MGTPLNPYETGVDCDVLPAGRTPKRFKLRFYNIRKCADNLLWSEFNASFICTQVGGSPCTFRFIIVVGGTTFHVAIRLKTTLVPGMEHVTNLSIKDPLIFGDRVFNYSEYDGWGVLAGSGANTLVIGTCGGLQKGYGGVVNWETY